MDKFVRLGVIISTLVVLSGAGVVMLAITRLSNRIAALEARIEAISDPRSTRARQPQIDQTNLRGRKLSILAVPMIGKSDTTYVLLEFSDFECPYCRQHAQHSLPRLKQEFVETGLLRYGFYHRPIDTLHAQASKLAQLADCAREQDKFWEIHDFFFSVEPHQSEITAASLARQFHLNGSRFAECVRARAPRRVQQAVQTADALGIRATPSFVLGRLLDTDDVEIVQQFRNGPYETISAQLRQALTLNAR
jgi:protein-disulfide isomerase